MIHFAPSATCPQDDDAALVRRIGRGDAQALAAAYSREAAPVYRYALALCGNPAWAADAVQEAFVALAGRPEGFDGTRGTLGAWLAGIARHALLAQWRRTHGEQADAHAGHADDDEPHEAGPPIDELIVRRQETEALWRAIRTLPWPFREALVLVDLQERSYEQAAAIAGIELNTLRTRLHRARARLAALLECHAGDPP